MYKIGDRVNVYVNGRLEKGAICAIENSDYIIRLLDGSEIVVNDSQISGKTN